MSLSPEQYLTACAASQMAEVHPALDGSFAGGTAGTIGVLLMFAVQDIAARPAREAAELASLMEIYRKAGRAMLDGLPAARAGLDALMAEATGDLRGMILDHFVRTTEAARLKLPI